MREQSELQPCVATECERLFVVRPWAQQNPDEAPPVAREAQGCRFRDAEGREYLDFASQLVNVNAGHQHPRIVEAIREQAARLCYAAPAFGNEARAELARLLAEITPNGLNRSVFTATGALANEVAFKAARAFTGRQKVISRFYSYHGGSYGTAIVGGDPRRRGVEPSVPGTVRVPDPYCYRCSFGKQYPECDLHCAEAIREVTEVEGPDTIAAMIMEPITGTNCRITPPRGYYERVRRICDDYGILLIFDEVMTGFGRTGEWFAADVYGVSPDIMTVSKGINSGVLPLGAAVLSDRVARRFESEMLYAGETQQGNPISCAAAVAAIGAYRDEGLVGNARRMGDRLRERLEELAERHPSIGEVRGRGLFQAIELVWDRETREPLVPWTEEWFRRQHPLMKRFMEALRARGLFTLARWNVVTAAPPLCVTDEEIDEGVHILDGALELVDQAIEH